MMIAVTQPAAFGIRQNCVYITCGNVEIHRRSGAHSYSTRYDNIEELDYRPMMTQDKTAASVVVVVVLGMTSAKSSSRLDGGSGRSELDQEEGKQWEEPRIRDPVSSYAAV